MAEFDPIDPKTKVSDGRETSTSKTESIPMKRLDEDGRQLFIVVEESPSGKFVPGTSDHENPAYHVDEEEEEGDDTQPLISNTVSVEGRAWEALTNEFPNASAIDLEADYGKKGRLQVKMHGFGKKTYFLFTKDKSTGEMVINPKLSKEIKTVLGDRRIELLRKNEEEIQQQTDAIAQDEQVVNDESLSDVSRDEARERINKNGERLAVLENEQERLEQGLPLRERIKTIFKKYWLTIVGVVAAVGTVIGVIVSNLKSGLSKMAKGTGNALKALGKKLGEILPGMVDAIANFIFKTAGEVIGFLAKHTWLLIVAVVVYFVEQLKKRKG